MKIELKDSVLEKIKNEIPNMTERDIANYIEMFCNDERTVSHITGFIYYKKALNKRHNTWDRLKEKIVEDVKQSVSHYSVEGYSSWVDKLEKECELQDEEREIYSDVLCDGFTNDELENIWRENN